MEEDLEHFLHSREVPNEDIMRMKRDKVDKAVLRIMADEQMANYIRSYGDRIAVLSFCQQTDTEQCSTDKETLLQRIRDRIGTRKMKSKTKGALSSASGVFQRSGDSMARQSNTAAEKTSRKIEIGWLHYGKHEYQQVRTRNGGGTRHVTVEKTATVADILEKGKDLFFPDGCSPKGPACDFTFDICDFKGKMIQLDDTVGRLYEKTKLKLLRFYIRTKAGGPSTGHSLSELNECSEDSLSEDLSFSITEGANSKLNEGGSHIDREGSVTELLDHRHPSDSYKINQMHHRTAQGPRQSEPSQSTPTDQRQGTNRSFPDPWSETIDLTSTSLSHSLQTEHEHIYRVASEDTELDEADTVLWDPEDNLGNEENVVITYHLVDSEDVTQSPEVNAVLNQELCLPSADGLTTLDEQSIHEEVVVTTRDREITFDLHSNSSGHLSPSSSSSNLGNPQTSQRASICRIKVVEDLLAVFMDSSILNLTLKMDFVNEKAVDDAGVSREVYTAFWEQFLEQCEGEMERVPRLRPDFGEAEWQAVGRIWVKGLTDHGVMPVRLSVAFIFACIHGIDSVDADVLMASFFNYLSPIERSVVEKALQGTREEGDDEDLLDLFTRMGSHFLPSTEGMKAAIETMAHKAILQEPKYIIDCFSIPMSHVFPKLFDKQSVLSLYDSKKATGKRVSQLLETTNVMLSQREQATFNHLQRYVKNAEQTKAEKFLRFCTGSSVICVDKIMIHFNAETGLNRRPVAHTCGATLEVPTTYSSFPEFRTEFDNILASNYLDMDIM
ncbi:uncharacterized protein LOC129187162 isoform X2 [Dunckerocampus dactyliophorus]|uniref:uncharacterized protein LOC129187162 isoform X2 n=1 Tax=Dunckerocampus dactyliophorus TaxID=161453 RepID=UPI002406FE72|nr:uncharacterized protein LOC129187162 isoform X2 [Dunckerocampus dactyliophorus]